MAEPRTRITGDRHPLVARFEELDAAVNREFDLHRHALHELLVDYRERCDNQSVYEVEHDSGGYASWRYLGPAEDYRHLLSQRGYVAVTKGTTWTKLMRQLNPGLLEERDAVDAALAAARQVQAPATLALLIAAAQDKVDWDTEETVYQAGRRLCRDAARELLDRTWPKPEPEDVFARFLVMCGLPPITPAELAGLWTGWSGVQRATVFARLDELGVAYGHMLDSEQIAARAGIAASTWRAYVGRSQAPAPDQAAPPRWHPLTVDAHRNWKPRVGTT